MMKKRMRKWKAKSTILIGLLCFICVFGLFGDSTRAADDIFITYNNAVLDPATTIEMNTSSMQLMLGTTGTAYDDDDVYQVKWTIEDPEQNNIVASISQGSSQTIGILRAISPGDVTVTVTIYDKTITEGALTMVGSATCNIRVVFSIDTTTDDSIYKYVNPTDTYRSLVLYADDPSVQLGLNFGAADSSNTQWLSSNEEIVTVTQNGGLVTPVGAGRTQVTATYTPSGESETYTAYLDVYVIPQVSTSATGLFSKSADMKLNSGEYIYTDTVFTNNLEVVRSKITWVIKQDDGSGNSTVIANSLGMESDLISLMPTASRTNELRVEGMAGEYDIYFYTYGSYESEANCTTAYTPTVIHLTIKSDISDRNETLSIGDSYNLAEAYNMTTEDFLSSFTVSVTMKNGSAADNYASYNSATGVLTAKDEGEVMATMQIRSGKESYIRALLGLSADESLPSSFVTNITIVDRIYLDRSNLTISVGQEQQLNVVLNGTYSGSITWSSSDSNYVTVNETGLIKGIKITKEDVTITATLDAGEGIYKTATCIVKVEETVSGFTLSPSEDQMMLVGEHLTIVAKIKQTVTVAPLDWISSDESIIKIEEADDGKSAIITAVGGGIATLTVYNPINKEHQELKVTVRIPISEIAFDNSELSLPLYKEGYNMKNHIKWSPANATDTELTWTTSDTSVATVDKDGYLTFTGAGTCLLSVYPTYNPYNVMASCIVTIIGTPDSMTISSNDVTMNVGDSEILQVDFEPKNTVTGLVWTPNDLSIVTIKYDEERQIATLVGKKPGTTNVNIVSTEGMISNIKVTVKQPSTALNVTPKELVIRTGDTQKLEVAFNPSDSTDSLVWKSVDASIAKVDAQGNVTGVKSGTTFVNVQAFNGKVAGPVALIQVVVQDGVKGVSLDAAEKEVKVGSTITISPIFNPTTAFNKEMTWGIANTKVAKIEMSGTSNVKVTGVAEGTTILTGTTADGGYSVSCLITVKPKDVNDTKVTVSPTTKFLQVGKSFYVTATVTGSSNKKIKWSTSKKKVCSVTKNGKVKGKKIGTAYITATSQNGSGAFARCKVRVVRKVSKIKLNRYAMTVLVGQTKKLKATVRPKKATIKSVKWSSSDNNIATVSSSGRVLGLAEGLVKIKAKAKDGSGKSATCIVSVREPVEATGVTVTTKELTIAKGRSMQSGIVASPANTTSSIKYYSDNKKVATVDKRGKIRTKAAGQATIYGETSNGKMGYVDVLVVDLNRKSLSMRVYDTEQLRVNMIDTGVTWYSKDINIASVSASGLVTGRRPGTTIIYANVNGVKLGCQVTIKKIK